MLTDPKQLLGPPLVRGKASNLADQVAHKLVVLGQLALQSLKVKVGQRDVSVKPWRCWALA